MSSEGSSKTEEEIGRKMQNMFSSIYEAIDLKYMRPMKREMFKCAHDCLDDRRKPKEAERCIDDCGKHIATAMTTVNNEVNAFQGRIDRCLMDCQDLVRNEKDESKGRMIFDNCADKCVNKFVPIVPDVIKIMCEKLDKVKSASR